MVIKEQLTVTLYEDATVVPRGFESSIGVGGAYDKNGVFIPYSGKRIYSGGDYTTEDRTYVETECVSEDIVYYIGDARWHWGHFLIDETSRMWALFDIPSDVKVVLFGASGDMPKWYIDFMELCGVNRDRLVIVKRPTRFYRLYFPELAYVAGKYVSPVWKQFFHTMTKPFQNGGGDAAERLYLSRTGLKTSFFCRNYGEKVLEKILSQNGYNILHPETMSVEKQLQLYANAKIIITTNGTLGHNVLFADDNVKLALINRVYAKETANSHQAAINLLLKQQPSCLTCSSRYSNHAVSYIGMTASLLEFFQENGIVLSKPRLVKLEFAVEYVKFCVMRLLNELKNLFCKYAQ